MTIRALSVIFFLGTVAFILIGKGNCASGKNALMNLQPEATLSPLHILPKDFDELKGKPFDCNLVLREEFVRWGSTVTRNPNAVYPGPLTQDGVFCTLIQRLSIVQVDLIARLKLLKKAVYS